MSNADFEVIELSEETVNTLRKLYDVDQSIRIDHQQTDDDGGTVLRTKSYNNTTMAKVKIEEQFPRDINIYDLREFISVLGIVEEPVLDLENSNYIVIHSKDGRQRLRYLEANPDLISSYIDKDPVMQNEDEVIEVTEHKFKSVMSAAQALRFEYVGFVASEGKLFLTAFNRNEGSGQENNSYSIELGENDGNFKLLYKMNLQNISILGGEGALTFYLDGQRKISKIETETNKTFWISFDSDSEYN